MERSHSEGEKPPDQKPTEVDHRRSAEITKFLEGSIEHHDLEFAYSLLETFNLAALAIIDNTFSLTQYEINIKMLRELIEDYKRSRLKILNTLLSFRLL